MLSRQTACQKDFSGLIQASLDVDCGWGCVPESVSVKNHDPMNKTISIDNHQPQQIANTSKLGSNIDNWLAEICASFHGHWPINSAQTACQSATISGGSGFLQAESAYLWDGGRKPTPRTPENGALPTCRLALSPATFTIAHVMPGARRVLTLIVPSVANPESTFWRTVL
jgi:hypothetical protein